MTAWQPNWLAGWLAACDSQELCSKIFLLLSSLPYCLLGWLDGWLGYSHASQSISYWMVIKCMLHWRKIIKLLKRRVPVNGEQESEWRERKRTTAERMQQYCATAEKELRGSFPRTVDILFTTVQHRVLATQAIHGAYSLDWRKIQTPAQDTIVVILYYFNILETLQIMRFLIEIALKASISTQEMEMM